MADNDKQKQQDKRTFHEVLKHFDTAMLVTRSSDGVLRARPMAIARAEQGGDLWFFTSVDSAKVGELLGDAHCAAVMQGSSRYLSLSGRAELVRDRGRIDELWRRAYEAWFEHGKDDPSLALIHFIAQEGEFWDASGTKGLRYALEVARALWRGGAVHTGKLGGTNARVDL